VTEFPSVLKTTACSVTLGTLTATRDSRAKTWTITDSEPATVMPVSDAPLLIVDPSKPVMTPRLIACLQDPRHAHLNWYTTTIEITPLMALQLHLEGTLRAFGVRVQRRAKVWHMLARQILTNPAPGYVVNLCIRSDARFDAFVTCEPRSH
jgi:hypothetical protein